MKKVEVLHYDAFSSIPNQGNPAGVVLKGNELSLEDMQEIAAKVGFNETVFVLQSDHADVKLKYFTPGHEINLCGHATMASLFAMKSKGLLSTADKISIETNVGVLPIQFDQKQDQTNTLMIKMKQDRPKFISFRGNLSELAESIGLTRDDLDLNLPVVYGSTGTWTLLVPIKKLSKFAEMRPINERFPSLLAENTKSSIHPFCMETYDPSTLMHARHFSSPYSGTIEDPVTGTASGVMGAYYLTYIERNLSAATFTIEQGTEIGRDGKVHVEVIRNLFGDIDVSIAGTAVYVDRFEVEYSQ